MRHRTWSRLLQCTSRLIDFDAAKLYKGVMSINVIVSNQFNSAKLLGLLLSTCL